VWWKNTMQRNWFACVCVIEGGLGPRCCRVVFVQIGVDVGLRDVVD
jgi:hypothetical protein